MSMTDEQLRSEARDSHLRAAGFKLSEIKDMSE